MNLDIVMDAPPPIEIQTVFMDADNIIKYNEYCKDRYGTEGDIVSTIMFHIAQKSMEPGVIYECDSIGLTNKITVNGENYLVFSVTTSHYNSYFKYYNIYLKIPKGIDSELFDSELLDYSFPLWHLDL